MQTRTTMSVPLAATVWIEFLILDSIAHRIIHASMFRSERNLRWHLVLGAAPRKQIPDVGRTGAVNYDEETKRCQCNTVGSSAKDRSSQLR